MSKFNPTRLRIARSRRQFTYKALSALVDLSPRMVAEYEKDYCAYVPKDCTIDAYAKALAYPRDFLLEEEPIEAIEADTVSFRSLKSMKASQQHAAIAAGNLGMLVNQYYESKFNLPSCNLIDLRGTEPEAAARMLRDYWRLGIQSIDNVIHLLELHGVRVYSLAENTQSVDAFSFWKDDTPYVFLNTQKSGERTRFDAAHELAHLILHKHGTCHGRDAEREADSFAAHFLMPRSSLIPFSKQFITLDEIIKLKENWKVSAMALIVQMHNIGALTDWQYRQLMIEASKQGLRKKEINGIEREKSMLHEKLIEAMFSDGFTLKEIADSLSLPLEEFTNLIFMVGLITNKNPSHSDKAPPKLRLIE